MKRLIIVVIALGVVAVGCKNRSTARMMEGTWYESKIDGTEVPVGQRDQITFGKCNGGKKKECDLTFTDCCGGGTFNYAYTVSEGGEKLSIKVSSGAFSLSSNHTLASVTENQIEIDWKWGDGNDYTGTYTK